jgi:hypothetical protein
MGVDEKEILTIAVGEYLSGLPLLFIIVQRILLLEDGILGDDTPNDVFA